MRVARLLSIILLAFAVIAAAVFLPDRLCFDNAESYTFYCGTSSADCKEVTVTRNASLTKLTLLNVCGEAAVYKNFDLNSFLKKTGAKIIFMEELSDSVNYYCAANLPYKVKINGAIINLHICVRGNTAKTASPIIFGGY